MTGSAKVSLYGSIFVSIVILAMVAVLVIRRKKCACTEDKE
jgi:hypothetical protein